MTALTASQARHLTRQQLPVDQGGPDDQCGGRGCSNPATRYVTWLDYQCADGQQGPATTYSRVCQGCEDLMRTRPGWVGSEALRTPTTTA